ncbi:MAG: S-methyl-5'-thioadenosine phosphorylase [Nitrospirae bacterium]|nr:S-methyl-5'-thioadenosine phosphorylase [Nitrospirota bacterium]MCL5238442.1 S-methyl-5'-thioadenosine phosphorylase [Nitrospirota bacterium]
MIGLIGGSGLYEIEGLEITKEVSVSTPFGEASSAYKTGTLGGIEIAFLSRHGIPHSIPPHKVNYRANIWGFKSLGVERVISVSAVGGINSSMPPGSIVLLDQIIDMTFGARTSTFYDKNKVIHVDFTSPYCNEMRGLAIQASRDTGLPAKETGTYLCVNGPRLETAREIQFFSLAGADMVGMTAMPEAALARELEICLLGISVVTNYAAGISDKKLTTTEVVETMRSSMEKIKSLLKGLIAHIPARRTCPCKDALKDAEL